MASATPEYSRFHALPSSHNAITAHWPASSETPWQRPGCGDACVRISVPLLGGVGEEIVECHDPDTHEAFEWVLRGSDETVRTKPRSRARPVGERLRELSIAEPNSGCLLYLGSIDRSGYGRFRVAGASTGRGAHCVAYEEDIGPIPDGYVIDHLCRNRACINPRHMEPVTRVENTMRGMGPTAVNARLDRCRKGHAFDDANTYTGVAGARGCRTCQREAVRRYAARRRGAW